MSDTREFLENLLSIEKENEDLKEAITDVYCCIFGDKCFYAFESALEKIKELALIGRKAQERKA